MTKSIYLPIAMLRYGHETTPPINSRRTGRYAEVEALAADIKAHGLIHPLKVQEGEPGVCYVADGNRRLAALLHLRDALGIDVDADLPVRCEVIPDGVNALEISQAANITHLPPHEADQFETFSLLAKTFQPAEIAGRFGIEVKRVHRMLALGELSPMILHAWRENALDGAAVRAFTLAPSVAEQERVFAELQKRGWLHAHQIKHAFGAGQNGVGHLVAYVGEEAYVAAGGSIRTDLFGTDHVPSDPALAKRMADEKLQLHCETLTAKHGWGWAASADTLPEGARYNWRRENGKIRKADRINYGCILSVTSDGTVSITEGVVRPEDRKKAEKAAALAELERQRAAYEVELAAAIERGEEPPPPPAQPEPEPEKKAAIVSNMLAERLSQQFTLAMQACIRQNAHLALAAITAGLQSGGYYSVSPVRLKCDGYQPERPETAAFEDAFDALSHMDMEQLLIAFCHAVAPSIDLQVSSNAKRVIDKEHNLALVDGTGEDLIMPALRSAFNAEDYFKNAPKALVLQAIAEGVNPDEARKVAGKPAPEIKAFALANIDTKNAFGWLPPELRTSHYDGPSLPGAWDAKPAKEDTAALAEGITELKPKRGRKAKAETVVTAEGEEAEVAA